ncbi:hypothetical protein BD770DRAFT_425411 [Pilaira anomala]|nr:hypothetical protein BD770DRAFT_425411 [Pilaira anomala]
MYQQPTIDYNTPSLPSLDRLVHNKVEGNLSSPIPTSYPKQQVYAPPKPNTQSLDDSLNTNSSTFYQRSDVDVYPTPSTYYPPSSVMDQREEHRIYSFMPLESVFQQKRPRRKFNEIERLYQCNFYNCTKAYGTLNHLNAHISMQEHGPKRLPIEFKELRKQLRKTKAQASAIKAKNEFTESQTSKKDHYREYNMMPQPSSYHPQHIAPLQHPSPHQGTLQMPQVPQNMAPLPPPPSSQMVPPPLTHPQQQQQQQLRHTQPMRPVTQQHITSPQTGQIQHIAMPQPSQGPLMTSLL